MQQELDAAELPVPVQIVGVNEDGHQIPDYDATFCNGRDLPFLEEGPGDDVWAAWRVRYRDVIILDEANEVIGVYNLTDNDLSQPEKYAELLEFLMAQGLGE